MGSAAAGLYRMLLRNARRMKQQQISLEIRKPLSATWGTYGYGETGLAYQGAALAQLVPGLRAFPGADKLDADVLTQAVRDNFRAPVNKADVPQRLDEAFNALRVLLEQLYLERCSSSCTTDGVRVDATSQFVHSGTFHGRPQHVFTYRIRVTNLRKEPVQVLGREWTIKNDRGSIVANIPLVSGNAIVGQQPIIPPDHCFEYTSGTDLDTPTGLQAGKLEVAVLENSASRKPTHTIHAKVAPFAHLQPGVQHK